jgi:Holliday junction resolvase
LSGASRGRERERQVRRYLESEEGGEWFVVKAGGSLGDADLVALKRGERGLILEVKSTVAGPFHSFGPKDREDLLAAAEKSGLEPYLVWYPPRGEMKWIAPVHWP